MNKIILEDLKESNVPLYIPQILPHQLATLDFLNERSLKEKKSVLLFHKMGSGKTIISLLFSIIASIETKILIILPNTSIMDIWISKLYDSLLLLNKNDKYNLNNIEFTTRSRLNEELLGTNKNINDIITENIKKYDNYIIIIDEAHNFFGNASGELLIHIKQNSTARYVLLTGSPISNTIESLKDIVELLTNETFEYNKYIESAGNKVFQQRINKQGIELLKNKLTGLISYYDEDRKDIPSPIFQGNIKLLNYPVVLCPMSKLQEDNYNMISNQTENDMFIKLMMNVSLVALGDKENYTNFDLLMASNKQIFPNFYVSNGKFIGQELIDLNISSKLKYFMNSILTSPNAGKRFIYFANSTIGSTIIRSVMIANGISEYDKEIVNNFVCVNCLKERNCNNKECIPMKFVIITSKESNKGNNSYINKILSVFNEDVNENGSVIMFLFGSRIIAEAYTLKDIKEIWFLTVPETKSELEQCIARAIRSFAYKDKNTRVVVRICLATTPNALSNEISQIIEKYKDESLSDEEKTLLLNKFEMKLVNYAIDLPYDLRKQLYSEFKSEKAKVAYNIFINLSILTNNILNDNILKCFIIEKIRRYSYENSRYKLKDILSYIKKNLKFDYKNKIEDYVNEFVNDGVVVYNKSFGTCYIDWFKDDIVVKQIILEFNNYLLSYNY
ncbi:ORF MSV113 putative early transcription factor small subunit VETF-S homolog (vaccinia D6R), similar to SW:P04308 [Melanoplus sanguinipes entomopoxvirus]|uniref:Early transcription factor 70 kDa subunit n=1 Tax=Melanoplus sanguinipes entomopoxvirus TaxID=83191 RepID=ETF1_MSEPV|nr:ORF MSV113 putative early transcription factor small subunit VETF-S homolog (vaccinia D6R), similar to SW:P04308 [Melanoplus sanguinipes entomopoxvirus]Q9YVX9.1 RecName: Full=Early transcription factor 70 kDa subunit; AltName: Full=ATP-dependent helicase VETFS; AltName: Full=ETF small subunit [Melanoplus sanguinipes entomopoxvirus]AAC97658.1 ORF MSV113 putative early transcription factor small subunit VETF-S homolog (vaccinia D6R), similar to SW:P04308 [Melanoplus sanguinipes entomopoxvirus 'O